MKYERFNSCGSVALVSTPWPLYSRPSIQIAGLKAYLQTQYTALTVEAHHIYLKVAETIGYRLYHDISERTWLAESVYAALLHPERFVTIEKLFYREARRKSLLRKVDFKALTKQVEKASNQFIKNTDWGSFGLAGFTVCLCQLTSALYFIKRIKDRFLKLSVVVGGCSFSEASARNLINAFREIDFVVIGEGERPLSQLVGYLREYRNLHRLPAIPGVVSAQSVKTKYPLSFYQLDDLSRLPIPDYSDYFDLLKTFDPQKHFFPTLPAEISRGCWWGKNSGGGRHSGCAFCNLNLQWDGYRVKGPGQVVNEVDHLTDKHKTLSVAFTDNLVPLKMSGEIFGILAELKKDFRLFCEIRASTPKRVLENMKRAGVQEIQIGIEALSTRLLDKLKKGTTAIQNLEIMKHCEELGLVNSSNLIIQFPGTDRDDVAETLRNLEFAFPFRPMRPVQFWLGMGSPVWQNPKTYGLKSVFNHPNWTVLFPSQITGSVTFMIQAYRGDRVRQKKLWQPVKQKLRSWEKTYEKLHQGPVSSPILSFRDGRDFLIIRQRRLNTEPMTHRLVDTSRAIYLFCQHHRSLRRILGQFPEVGEDKILPFLKMMVEKKLMFTENDKYLSLAVPIRR
jgi:ribosomal peptide maturation radical SAM protein 1